MEEEKTEKKAVYPTPRRRPNFGMRDLRKLHRLSDSKVSLKAWARKDGRIEAKKRVGTKLLSAKVRHLCGGV